MICKLTQRRDLHSVGVRSFSVNERSHLACVWLLTERKDTFKALSRHRCAKFVLQVRQEPQTESKSVALLLQQNPFDNWEELTQTWQLCFLFDYNIFYCKYTLKAKEQLNTEWSVQVRGLGVTFLTGDTDTREELHFAPNQFEAVIVDESWHVLSRVFINAPQLSSERRPQPCVQDRFGFWGGRFWRRSVISNGSGSHNGGTLSDLSGMRCGRQRGRFDLDAYVHWSVPCLKTDLLSDISLP